MSDEREAPPWADKEELAKLEASEQQAQQPSQACPPAIELIDFNLVKGELESLEKKMVWKKRFKIIMSIIFIATFALLIYLMPLSVGISVISLGGLVVPDRNLLKLAAVLATAFSGIGVSLFFGLGKLGTIGLAASASAPILYLSSIKSLILTYIHF